MINQNTWTLFLGAALSVVSISSFAQKAGQTTSSGTFGVQINLNTNQVAQDVYTQEEINAIAFKAGLIGKTFSDKCEPNNASKRICLDDIKALFTKKVVFRVIRPDTAVTLDFSNSRININLNRDGAITFLQLG